MSFRYIVWTSLFVMAVAAAVLLPRLPGASWEELEHASGVFVNLTILLGAAAAIVKFQLYNLLGHRWRSELTCKHYDLPDGTVVFTADYTITNTGQRPLTFSEVHVRLRPAVSEDVLLKPDLKRCLAERIMSPTESTLKGMFQVEPSERSIFTLRCRLPHLPDVVFVQCGFDYSEHRVPAAFMGLYVKPPRALDCNPDHDPPHPHLHD